MTSAAKARRPARRNRRHTFRLKRFSIGTTNRQEREERNAALDPSVLSSSSNNQSSSIRFELDEANQSTARLSSLINQSRRRRRRRRIASIAAQMKLIFVCLCLLLRFERLETNLLRVRRQSNGCGTSSFNVDRYLFQLGLEMFVRCCDEHDLCYDRCGEKKLRCDDRFLHCLLDECAKLSADSSCQWNSRMFFWVVFFAGRSAFDKAQLDHRC